MDSVLVAQPEGDSLGMEYGCLPLLTAVIIILFSRRAGKALA